MTRPSSKKLKLNACDGFTLMELMVVVAIIAILASIGLPTFKNFIAKSIMAEAMEEANFIGKAVKLYVDQNTQLATGSLTDTLTPGAGRKGNLGGSTPADEITTIIPELKLPEDATFRYEIDASVDSSRNVRFCIKAYKPSNTAGFILYSSKPSAKPEWGGKFYDKTFLDNTVLPVSGGYCESTGLAAASDQG